MKLSLQPINDNIVVERKKQLSKKSGEKVRYFHEFGQSNLSLIDFVFTFQVNPRGFLEGSKQKAKVKKNLYPSKKVS